MKKITLLLSIILILGMTLTGCCIKHDWKPATCTEPETCSKCGETRGEMLGHDFTAATCTSPAICKRCGITAGEKAPHTWTKGNCTVPATCTVCGAEKELQPHTWIEATCIQPRHCAVCGITEGEKLPHQWNPATYNSPRTCAVCGLTEGEKLTSYIDNGSGNGMGNQSFSYMLTTGNKQDYSTITGYNNKIAKGTVTVTEYNKYQSDSSHPYKEGYEWREVKVTFSMDRPSRVMWGYTDSYAGLSEYARTNYITYADGTREQVEATQSFYSMVATPSVTAGATPSPSPTPTPTPTQAPSPTPSPTATVSGTVSPTPGVSASPAAKPSPPTAPQITPSPSPSPTPESEPDKYVSYVTQAVRVPVTYDGLIFYVCNADYEKDHKVDNSFLYMKMY